MDFIVNLPSDKIPLSSEEKDVFDWLYPMENKKEDTVTKEVILPEKTIEKEVQNKISIVPLLIMVGLIFLFTFRPVDQFLQNKIPSLFKNSFINSLMKTILFIGILLLVHFVTFLLKCNKKNTQEK